MKIVIIKGFEIRSPKKISYVQGQVLDIDSGEAKGFIGKGLAEPYGKPASGSRRKRKQ